MPSPSIPKFAEPASGLRASWGILGDDDLESANLPTPEVAAAAADEIPSGERINVSLGFHNGVRPHSARVHWRLRSEPDGLT